MTEEELVQALVEASARLGMPVDEAVVTEVERLNRAQVQLMKEALFARLDGQVPPCRLGDTLRTRLRRVNPVDEEVFRVSGVNYHRDFEGVRIWWVELNGSTVGQPFGNFEFLPAESKPDS